MSFGYRAGFIEDDGGDTASQLEHRCTFDEDAHARAASCSNEDGGRRRKPKCAGACNNKDSGGVQDCCLQARRFGPEDHPQEKDKPGKCKNGRRKPGADLIGDTRNGRLFALRILDHPDHLRDGGVEADMRRAEPYGSREVDRPTEHIVIYSFVDGHAFASQQCFIGGCFANCDHAIHWNQVSWAHENHRIWHDPLDGDID